MSEGGRKVWEEGWWDRRYRRKAGLRKPSFAA